MSIPSKEKKTIYLVFDAFSVGGAQRNFELIAPELLKLQYKIHLVLLQNSQSEIPLNNFKSLGIQITRINAKNMFDLLGFIRFLKTFRRDKEYLLVANLYWSQIWSSILKIIRIQSKNFSIYWVENNYYLKRTRKQWLVFYLMSKYVNKIVCISSEISEYLKKRKIVNTLIIPCAISQSETSRQDNRRRNKNNFVFLGRLVDQKNPLLTLKAFAYAKKLKLISTNSKLIFIGNGPLHNNLKKLASTLKIQKCVKFYLNLDRLNIYKLLSTSGILISNSDFEGFQIARLEAMLNGMCVLTTLTPGVMGVLGEMDEKNRFKLALGVHVVEPNSKSIANGLQELSKNIYWSKDKVTRRKKVAMRYSPRLITSQYEKLFQIA